MQSGVRAPPSISDLKAHGGQGSNNVHGRGGSGGNTQTKVLFYHCRGPREREREREGERRATNVDRPRMVHFREEEESESGRARAMVKVRNAA